MIGALDRKLLRDLGRIKGQSLAVGAVVASGIAVYIGWLTTSISLTTGLESYYRSERFAEVFASLKKAPLSMADRIASLPGVAMVDARIVKLISLDLPTMDEAVSARLISLPNQGEAMLNGVHLIGGRFPEAVNPGEVMAQQSFMNAHGLRIGDNINAILNGRMQSLRIVGMGMSPEYLSTVQPGSIFPDDRRFGIFWMRRSHMEAAFDMAGAFNDVALSLAPGARTDHVMDPLDELLERYGGLGSHDRERQLSHRFISDELAQMKVMTLIPPAIFLSVAAYLLNAVIRRLLNLQRSQIAVLKAFGYSNLQIGWHYGKLAGVILTMGSVFGCVAGTELGKMLTALYSQFYRFPSAVFHPFAMAYVSGMALSWLAGLAGVFGTVWQALRIQPAEAMRPPAPPVYTQTWYEKRGFNRWMSQTSQMVVRELFRKPLKAFLTTFGIALACAVIVMGHFGEGAINFLADLEFGMQQRQNATINFADPLPSRVMARLRHIDGIVTIEPFRMVSVRLRAGQYSRQLGLMGIPEKRDLFRLLDKNLREVPLPSSGLTMSSHLAGILKVQTGDRVIIEFLEKDRFVREVNVTALVNDYTGTNAYMKLETLNSLLRDPPLFSGAFLKLDSSREQAAYAELKNIPAIVAVNLQGAAFKSFMSTFAENILQLQFVNLIFATIIAVGVVYNNARITLSERSRELATLRVIGFTRGEVTGMLLGELAFLTAVAIPTGCLIGYGLCWAIASNLPTEHFRIPLVIESSTYLFAAGVIAFSTLVSAIVVKLGIDSLDLVSVLKSGE